MSPTDRCDQVIRLIDEALDDDGAEGEDRGGARADGDGPGSDATSDAGGGVEAVPGHWGVYYLKPGA